MLSPETFPQSIKDNVTGVEFPFHPINKAMVVSFKNGLDASVVTGPMHGGLYEIAVGVVGLGVWEECPLTEESGIVPDLDDEGVVQFLAQVAEFSSADIDAAKAQMERDELAALVTVTQFGVLRLAGLTGDDDPYEYINGTDSEREALGLSEPARKALANLDDLHLLALDKLTEDKPDAE